VKREL